VAGAATGVDFIKPFFCRNYPIKPNLAKLIIVIRTSKYLYVNSKLLLMFSIFCFGWSFVKNLRMKKYICKNFSSEMDDFVKSIPGQLVQRPGAGRWMCQGWKERHR
jgi:hypothetical protein